MGGGGGCHGSGSCGDSGEVVVGVVVLVVILRLRVISRVIKDPTEHKNGLKMSKTTTTNMPFFAQRTKSLGLRPKHASVARSSGP